MRIRHQPESPHHARRAAVPRRRAATLWTALLVFSGSLCAEEHASPIESYDRRTEIAMPAKSFQPTSQRKALTAFAAEIPELRIEIDPRTGATRTIANPMGSLSKPAAPGFDAETVARSFLARHREALGLEPDDLETMVLTDAYEGSLTGTHHFYFQQTYFDIPAYGAQLQVHVGADGAVQGVKNGFLPGLSNAINARAPSIDAKAAISRSFDRLGMTFKPNGAFETKLSDPRLDSRVGVASVEKETVDAMLMWLPVVRGDARLVWNFLLDFEGDVSMVDVNVDALSGEVWTLFDRVRTATHRAFLLPRESPYTDSGSIPVDGRGFLISFGDPPAGWHQAGTTSYTIHRGNNVHAYADPLGFGFATASQPDCGVNLNCSFPLDFRRDIRTYTDASISNLFYMVNTLHDIQYRYGFDERAGNFQADNFDRGGLDGDPVIAITQSPDTGAFRGPRFNTLPDGTSPRLIMPLWRYDGPPTRDTAWDNLVIAHEYAHGVSMRLVGGPTNVGCLNQVQSASLGEGWSDFFGLWYTAEAGDRGTDGRGVGQWAIGEPASHKGLRPKRYSTSQRVNNHTYESVRQESGVHDAGSIWAQALWEVYWALVDKYGFDARLKDAWRNKGNHRAMRYVTDAMPLTSCRPTFLDARDGIIEAVGAYRGGEDRCLVWDAFAKFGLGLDARSGPVTSFNDARNGFQIPADCCTTETPAFVGAQGFGPLCQDNAVVYETRVDSAVDTYRWELVDGSGRVVRSSTTSVPRFSLGGFGLASGSYTLRVRAQRSCGAVSGWRSRSIVLQPSGSPGCCDPSTQACLF